MTTTQTTTPNNAKQRFYILQCPTDGSWSVIDHFSRQAWNDKLVPCAVAHYRPFERDRAQADANGRNAKEGWDFTSTEILSRMMRGEL